jgi:hypothetical protein
MSSPFISSADYRSLECSSDDEDEAIMELIEEFIIQECYEEETLEDETSSKPAVFKTRTLISTRVLSFDETSWGQMLKHPDVSNPKKAIGKRFRRRFRLPYPLFQILVNECNQNNVFEQKYHCRIPIEAKVLACLRILGRDASADDINELSSSIIGESTVNVLFKKFVVNFANTVYPTYVQIPSGDYLQEVLDVYSRLGFPGCVGSMDCTRIKWDKCPKVDRHGHIGKEGFPTLVFQVVVDHMRRVHHVSIQFTGMQNDQGICQNDTYSLAIIHGALANIEYELYNDAGEKYRCRGGYLVVDGGYLQHICFIDPDRHRMTREVVLWSEWLESIRKDVECFFGILKTRWRFFRNAVSFHNPAVIAAAFKTCAALHNMILIYDGRSSVAEWEDVNWEALDPNTEGLDEDEVENDAEDIPDPIVPGQEAQTGDDGVLVTTAILPRDEVTFPITGKKRHLKDALQRSFTVQWIKNKLQWPKNFTSKQRVQLPLARATLEMKRALQGRPSCLRALDVRGEYRKDIGNGLYSLMGYKRDDLIATYVGNIRTRVQFDALLESEPVRQQYSIAISSKGDILDCYDAFRQGLCMASFANEARACFNTVTNKAAQPNCRIVVDVNTSTAYIRAGLKYPVRSPNNFYIPNGHELICSYGAKFYYNPDN